VEHLFLIEGSLATTATGNGDNNRLFGNSLNNTLNGLDGSDMLLGGGGADRMVGGAGDDVYQVDMWSESGPRDEVVELAGGGADRVDSLVDYTLPAEVEDLTLGGTAIRGTGNGLANGISGNQQDNILDGGAGADQLYGGAGNDTYIVDNASDTILEDGDMGEDLVRATVSHTLALNVENLELLGTSTLNGIGNDSANHLTGNSAANRLEGLAGDDTLDGGGGADRLIGGDFNDTYIVDALDTVEELADGGFDTIVAGFTYTLGAELEALRLVGTDAINGTGNGADNILVGNSAANTLNGGAGWDWMEGGDGNDTFHVDEAGDVVIEATGQGNDLVISSASFVIDGASEVEELRLVSGAADGTGNDFANRIVGNEVSNRLFGNGGDDVLDGQGGTDILSGGEGNDTYYVDSEFDEVVETGAGVDTVYLTGSSHTLGSMIENMVILASGNAWGSGNVIKGGTGLNHLDGLAGNDSLYGGAGVDFLSGGEGADGFYFDTTPALNNIDYIEDFVVGEDKIYLSAAIFTQLSGTGLSAQQFRLGPDAYTAEQRIIYDNASGDLYYDPDGNGAAAQVQIANLYPTSNGLAPQLTLADFVIVP
jgi:Ca2+-binding RTX toxin-like protein